MYAIVNIMSQQFKVEPEQVHEGRDLALTT